MTHDELVDMGRKYLLRNHPLVITEMATIGEEADVIGWRSGISTLIEAKASISDFYADSNKPFRILPEMGMGNYRYYIAPKGLLSNVRKWREGWGLLEVQGRSIKKVREAVFQKEINYNSERSVMISAFRRIGQACPAGVSCKPYYINTGNRATINIENEE